MELEMYWYISYNNKKSQRTPHVFQQHPNLPIFIICKKNWLIMSNNSPYWLIKSSFKFFVTWWVSKLLLFLTPATISFFFKDSLNNRGNSSFNLALYYISHKEVVSPVPIKTLLLFKNNHMEPNIPFQK